MNVTELKLGEIGKIIGIVTKDLSLKMKLTNMGIIKGEIIKVLKIAPLGDPIEVEIKGYNLSLRKNEACYIKLEETNDEK
jgi:Fe2+ transport system protein FeoA